MPACGGDGCPGNPEAQEKGTADGEDCAYDAAYFSTLESECGSMVGTHQQPYEYQEAFCAAIPEDCEPPADEDLNCE